MVFLLVQNLFLVSTIPVSYTHLDVYKRQGEGLMKKAMVIMTLGAGLNIILDPLLMIAMRNIDRGIEGAAIATV